MTFSLIGRDPATGTLGLAVSTAAAAVGKRVPHVEPGVGLVATQGKTNIRYGSLGLKLMAMGFTPQQALETVLRQDENRAYRQVLMTDCRGDWAVHTGARTERWHGHLVGEHAVALGNTLPGRQVLDAMATAFARAEGELSRRLLAGLRAGQDAGGDREGRCSAAIVVVDPRAFAPWGLAVDLRVDFDPDPVYRLAEVLERYLDWEERRRTNVDRRIYAFSPAVDATADSEQRGGSENEEVL